MLIAIKYHQRKYPNHIKPEIEEIAGHFDVSKIAPKKKFSIHTEYSYGKRNFNSLIIEPFTTIQCSNKRGIPQLWYSTKWALEFVSFIKNLCSNSRPTIIEIHPPFSDYMKSIKSFLDIYEIFEKEIQDYSPSTKILIENRFGSMYRDGKFLISRGQHLRSLCNHILAKKLTLRIALDLPQLLSAYGGPEKLEPDIIEKILKNQLVLQPMIDSIHLWGKKRNTTGRWISHAGDLDTYFENHLKKEIFLKWIAHFLQDNRQRYFLPEVNSTDEDLHSIINDLESKNIVIQ